MAPEDANKVNSIVYLISAFVSPLFGLMIDKTGRNLFWVFLSINVTVVAHMLLAFTQINPYYAMVSMHLHYYNIYFMFSALLKKVIVKI